MAAERADMCPRCSSEFHCGANDAAPCACTTLNLSDELLTQLRARFVGCLCVACLAELSLTGGTAAFVNHPRVAPAATAATAATAASAASAAPALPPLEG